MTWFYQVRNLVRIALIRYGVPLLPRALASRLSHSLDRPFGNRYYQDRAYNYDRDREHQVSWQEEQVALSEISAELGRNLTVLDVPVGTGRFFPIYAGLGWEVTGIDISKEMLEVARNRSAGLFEDFPLLKVGRAHKLPFPNSEFDVVVCFRFLQSIVSFGVAQRVIAEISRVTRSYAVLHLDVRAEEEAPQQLPTPRQTMKGKLNRRQIEDILKSVGLEIIKVIGPINHETKNEHVFLCAKKER